MFIVTESMGGAIAQLVKNTGTKIKELKITSDGMFVTFDEGKTVETVQAKTAEPKKASPKKAAPAKSPLRPPKDRSECEEVEGDIVKDKEGNLWRWHTDGTRHEHIYLYDGKYQSTREWAAELGIKPNAMEYRLKYSGCPYTKEEQRAREMAQLKVKLLPTE